GHPDSEAFMTTTPRNDRRTRTRLARAALVVASLLALAALALAPASRVSAQPAAIRVSYQPGTYWSLPFEVATRRGFWAQEGLSPELVRFPSGAPQVDARAQGGWDVGAMGSAPAILGAARFGLLTIGVSNDESLANAVMVRGDAAGTWLRKPRR